MVAYRGKASIIGPIALVFLVALAAHARAAEEIPITTSSVEARKLFLEGREMIANYRSNEARSLFSQALEKDPGFALAYLYRAYAGISYQDFLEHVEKAHAAMANVSEGERLLIEAQYRAGVEQNLIKGVELLEELVEKYPEDKQAREQLAGFYQWMKQEDKALVQLQKVTEIDPDYPSAYNSLGYLYFEREEFEQAESAFKNYIRLLPDQANPHDSIADLYTKMGRFGTAIDHYRKAVELDPKFSYSQRKIGTNLVFLGQYEQGRQAYHRALEIEPTAADSAETLLAIARSYLYQEQPRKWLEQSEEALTRAVGADLVGFQGRIHWTRCETYIELGDLEAAEKSLAAHLEAILNSELPEAPKTATAQGKRFLDGRIASKRGAFEQALAIAETYRANMPLDKDPTRIEVYHTLLGFIQFEKGEYGQAVEHFDQGGEESPYVLYHLAMAALQEGETERGAELLEKVANWNEDSFSYALVRAKARAMLAETGETSAAE